MTPPSKDVRGPIRVLHVDDDPDLAALTAQFLERNDDRIRVETATDGAAGLDSFQSAEFDCVVSDYDMPGMDGLDLLRAVRQEDTAVPFILYTGKGSEEVASEAIAHGVTDYLQKESGTEQYELLANRILNVVQQHRATRRAADLERIRRVLRDVNQALVRAETRDEIESRVVEIISEADPYCFVWIGDHDSETQTVEPRAAAGVEEGYLATVDVTTDDTPTGKGPTGEAVRTRDLAVMQNIPENDEYEPWREEALERGYRSSAAVPIVYDDTLYGVLNVYADRVNAFDERERNLLEELAGDVAHAISHATVRARQRRYERIIENLPVGVFRATPDASGQVIDVNPAFADIFDAESVDSMVGRDVTSFYADPETRTALTASLSGTGEVWNEQRRLETLAGDEIWAEITALQTEADGSAFVDGIVREITERKERERQLRLFRNAVEASGHSIYFTDSEGTIQYVNPAFEETTGYSADEAIGENPRILRSGEHDDEFYANLWATILSGEVWRNELVNVTKGGDRYVVDQTIAPVEGASGDIDHFVAVNADITDEKERKRELAQSRERWQAIFENSPDAIAVHDEDGDIVAVNQQNVSNLGYSREELLSMNVADFDVGHSRNEQRDIWAEIDVGERVEVESQHRRKDGTTFPVEVWVTKIEIDGEKRFIALGRDIRESKLSERELERKNERLQEIIGIISHDLRNPLNVVEGRLALVAEECDSGHLAHAERALDRCESLVEELLTLVEQGELVTEFEPVDLTDVVERCWAAVASTDATLHLETDRTVLADWDRLSHLFENLLRNGVEHAGADVTVTVGTTADGFYVEDDGPGIPDEYRDRVFESGFSTADHGNGLGLAIVDEVVNAHEWEIDVTEGSDGGARFEISDVTWEDER